MNNIKFFVAFLAICKIFSIVPISDKSIYIKYYRAYSLLIILLVIINCYFHITDILYNDKFYILESIYKVVDYLVNFFESIAVVVLVIMNIFYRPNTLRNIFEKLKNFENFTGTRNCADLWTIFIFLNLLISFLIIYQPLICLTYFVEDVCMPYIGRIVLWYYKTLTVMLLYVLAKEMKLKFTSVNELLVKTGRKLSGNFGEDFQYVNDLNGVKKTALKDLGHIKKMYDKLCDIVDDYNEVFGVTLLSYTLVTISNILLWSIVAIYSDILENKLISAIWLFKTIVSFNKSNVAKNYLILMIFSSKFC